MSSSKFYYETLLVPTTYYHHSFVPRVHIVYGLEFTINRQMDYNHPAEFSDSMVQAVPDLGKCMEYGKQFWEVIAIFLTVLVPLGICIGYSWTAIGTSGPFTG